MYNQKKNQIFSLQKFWCQNKQLGINRYLNTKCV